jgi:hypothetical protein
VFHAVAYGLHIRSTHPIPGLAPAQGPAPDAPDVDIVLGQPIDAGADEADAHYVSPHLNKLGEPIVTIRRRPGEGGFVWLYHDGLRYQVDAAGRHIVVYWPGTGSIEEAALNLLGPILGFVLRLRGRVCLHASALAVDGRALVLIGPQFSGKSTTAAALLARGLTLVSEDVVPLVDHGDHFDALPGYPLVRLWPSSVGMLYGEGADLPLLTPTRNKRRLDVADRGLRFASAQMPLAAVYRLDRRVDDARAPWISPVTSSAALMALVGDTYTNYALSPAMRAREFELLGRLSSHVPFRSVTPHSDGAKLPDLCEAILADFAAIVSPVRAGAPA